jgi:DNA-directed RNA polymerases I, II, and III subunit RPABC2
MDTNILVSEDPPLEVEIKEVMDAEVSGSETESDEEVDASIDSDDNPDDNPADNIEELSDSETDININQHIVSIHETYSNYYSTDKITSPILTKFERAKILGIRAEMLANGAEPVISKPYPNNTYQIALEELKQKKIPLIIRRTLPNGNIEDWRLDDLIIRI